MKVIDSEKLRGTEREVDCPKGGFKSLRMLLAKDGMGYTLTKTTIPVGEPQFWHYEKHLETCFCIQGKGILTNLETQEGYEITPGIAYVLDGHEPHLFQALEEVILVCVFNPPLTGREVHNENGAYELNSKKESNQ